jgi:XTP/dITP diphosphohydrolase
MKAVFASNNLGKINEIHALTKSLDLELIPQSELGVSEIEETGLTFIENALLKARHASALTQLPALADDSGLIVRALQGAPGIYSARYAGENANSKKNIEKLLSRLEGIPDNERSAAFYCVLVFITHANDPTPLICEGLWHGTLLTAPTGDKGFGYDPVFYDTNNKCSAAQLPSETKNRISHRGQALQLLIKKLPEKLCLHSQ